MFGVCERLTIATDQGANASPSIAYAALAQGSLAGSVGVCAGPKWSVRPADALPASAQRKSERLASSGPAG
eukprot:6516962-Alexandrium_andersonii.AAC.1